MGYFSLALKKSVTLDEIAASLLGVNDVRKIEAERVRGERSYQEAVAIVGPFNAAVSSRSEWSDKVKSEMIITIDQLNHVELTDDERATVIEHIAGYNTAKTETN